MFVVLVVASTLLGLPCSKQKLVTMLTCKAPGIDSLGFTPHDLILRYANPKQGSLGCCRCGTCRVRGRGYVRKSDIWRGMCRLAIKCRYMPVTILLPVYTSYRTVTYACLSPCYDWSTLVTVLSQVTLLLLYCCWFMLLTVPSYLYPSNIKRMVGCSTEVLLSLLYVLTLCSVGSATEHHICKA